MKKRSSDIPEGESIDRLVSRAINSLHDFSRSWCTRTHTNWDMYGSPYEEEIALLIKLAYEKGKEDSIEQMTEDLDRLKEGRRNSKYHKNYIATHIVEKLISGKW
jgi:hypothetical protein